MNNYETVSSILMTRILTRKWKELKNSSLRVMFLEGSQTQVQEEVRGGEVCDKNFFFGNIYETSRICKSCSAKT